MQLPVDQIQVALLIRSLVAHQRWGEGRLFDVPVETPERYVKSMASLATGAIESPYGLNTLVARFARASIVEFHGFVNH